MRASKHARGFFGFQTASISLPWNHLKPPFFNSLIPAISRYSWFSIKGRLKISFQTALDITSILVSDMGGTMSFNDTRYLDSKYLVSRSYDLNDDQMKKV